MTLELSYLSLTLFINIILILFGFKAIKASTNDSKLNLRRKTILILALSLWQIYIFAIASSGLIYSFDFPPRFALFTIVPLFLFTSVFFRRQQNKKWITAIPASWLFIFQSFRILVESIFVATVTAGILHKEVTILGYNYDMIFAISVPIIFLFVFILKIVSKKLILFWDYLGLTVIASIIFVFMTTIYIPEMYGYVETPAPLEMTKYPYVLIAGFLMPVAVFVHVWSIVRYHKTKNHSSSST